MRTRIANPDPSAGEGREGAPAFPDLQKLLLKPGGLQNRTSQTSGGHHTHRNKTENIFKRKKREKRGAYDMRVQNQRTVRPGNIVRTTTVAATHAQTPSLQRKRSDRTDEEHALFIGRSPA